MFKKRIVFLLFFTSLVCGIVYADPGETDEKEGHYDRLTGEYHYHRQVAPPVRQNGVAIRSLAIADAERDALRDAKSDMTWYGAGFLFGVIGIGAAYVTTPVVPPVNLLGKSPEYLLFYSTAYQEAVKQKHVEEATTGCVIGGIAVIGYYLYASGELGL